jgi:hypothetical protein
MLSTKYGRKPRPSRQCVCQVLFHTRMYAFVMQSLALWHTGKTLHGALPLHLVFDARVCSRPSLPNRTLLRATRPRDRQQYDMALGLIMISRHTAIVEFFATMSTWRLLYPRQVLDAPLTLHRERISTPELHTSFFSRTCSSIPAVPHRVVAVRPPLWSASSAVLRSRIEDSPGSFPMRSLIPHCLAFYKSIGPVSTMTVAYSKERNGLYNFLSAPLAHL